MKETTKRDLYYNISNAVYNVTDNGIVSDFTINKKIYGVLSLNNSDDIEMTVYTHYDIKKIYKKEYDCKLSCKDIISSIERDIYYEVIR